MTDAELLAKAVHFEADEHVTVECRRPNGWAVYRCRSVLTKSGKWVYEPLPSSRTAAFIKRTRFPTARDAFAAYHKWRDKELRKETNRRILQGKS